MSRVEIRIFNLIAFLTCLLSMVSPLEAQMLKIKDGTVLTGVIEAEPFTIKTPYGVLKVPISDIVQIIEEEMWLKNSSHFFGTLIPQTITVKTGYGDLQISTEQVIWINFVGKEKPKPPKSDP